LHSSDLLTQQGVIKNISQLPPRKLINPKDENWDDVDNIIFNSLNLTRDEQDAVYEAVATLVEARLKKAVSLQNR
jgi:hypothetical protein